MWSATVMLVTLWRIKDIGDAFYYIGDFWVYNIGHQHLKSVTNIPKLSPTHFVSNIRQQHRCSPVVGPFSIYSRAWTAKIERVRIFISNLFCDLDLIKNSFYRIKVKQSNIDEYHFEWNR